MTEEKKKVLAIHRLRNWIKTFDQVRNEIASAQAHLVELGHSAGYARLEAEEELNRLREMGLSEEQITGTLAALGVSGEVFMSVLSDAQAQGK